MRWPAYDRGGGPGSARRAEPALREQVATALVNKGATLGQLGRSEGGRRRVRPGGGPGSARPPGRACASRSPWRWSIRASRSASWADGEAAGVYDEVVTRFGGRAEPELREQVAMALVNKGVRLGRLGRAEDEDAGVRRGGGPGSARRAEPALREQVAMALVNKGITLGRLGRSGRPSRRMTR